MSILDEVEARIRKYCVLPSDHHYVAATLWVAATHVAPIAHTATRMVIVAPEKQCGKSRLLEVVQCLSNNPESLVDTSKAALVGIIDLSEAVTIFGDEADEWLPKGGPIVGILNAGFQRGKYRRIMVDGKPVKQSTFAFACLAGIGRLPGTIEDRAIMFHMQRRLPSEKVSPFRFLRDQVPLAKLGNDLHEELNARIDDLRVIEPVNPLEDRPADCWDLLLGIGELFTPANQMQHPESWAFRGREAAIALTDAAAELQEATRSQKLLTALRAMFKRTPDGKLRSADIVKLLHRADPEMWGEDFGTKQLSDMLGQYGIKSTSIKFKGETSGQRGYRRDMFADTFARYLQEEERDLEAV